MNASANRTDDPGRLIDRCAAPREPYRAGRGISPTAQLPGGDGIRRRSPGSSARRGPSLRDEFPKNATHAPRCEISGLPGRRSNTVHPLAIVIARSARQRHPDRDVGEDPSYCIGPIRRFGDPPFERSVTITADSLQQVRFRRPRPQLATNVRENWLHIDWAIALASVIVGFTVGLTGMGGGALMTPILLIFFGISPTAAVSSDLVAAMVMKPVGGGVHVRRRTVRWELVRWLCVGSIPAAFAGVLLLHATRRQRHHREHHEDLPRGHAHAGGGRHGLQGVAAGTAERAGPGGPARHAGTDGTIHVRIPLTILIGAIGGMLVGLTSVGSGSIIIVCLMLTYPELRGAQLVGTDLVQAVPLVTSAALAHILVGDFELGLTTSILIGALPAVYVGARLSSKAPDGIIRPALVFVLLASALKLLNVPTGVLGVILLAVVLVGLPIWGAVDGAAHPQHLWDSAGLRRRTWLRWQAFGAPVPRRVPRRGGVLRQGTAEAGGRHACDRCDDPSVAPEPAAVTPNPKSRCSRVRADPRGGRRVAEEREDDPHGPRSGRALRLDGHRSSTFASTSDTRDPTWTWARRSRPRSS